jgi:hypothetical protein
MTEETPKKKPRKKRRTKAQIEAEAAKLADAEAARQSALIAEAEAAEAAKEKEIELEFGSSYEKEIDEILEQDCGVHIEEKTAEAEVIDDDLSSSPATYANPNMERIANRFKHRRAVRRAKLRE